MHIGYDNNIRYYLLLHLNWMGRNGPELHSVNEERDLKGCFQTIICSGVAGRGGPGVRTPPPPPELPSGAHAKSKNPVRIFFVEGGGVGATDGELARTPPEPPNPPTPLNICIRKANKVLDMANDSFRTWTKQVFFCSIKDSSDRTWNMLFVIVIHKHGY